MINHKHLESVSLSLVESPLQAARSSACPSVWRPLYCAGSGPTRKYKMGLGPILEMESSECKPGHTYSNQIPRNIPRSHLQRSGSKTRYGLLEYSPNLSIGLYLCFIFYYLGLLNYFLIIVESHSFSILLFTEFAHQSC